MSAALIDGAALARRVRESLAPRVAAVQKARKAPPKLAIIAWPEDPAGEAYRQAQAKAAKEAGLEAAVTLFTPWTAQAEALKAVKALAADASVDGIIVDLPLPKHIKEAELRAALPPEKDAEGMTPANFGRLFQCKSYEEARELPLPCTALAVAELLRETRASLPGKKAVVVGRSAIVGKPAAHLLTCLDLTVSLCHSKTLGLKDEIAQADVVVACLGKAQAVKGAWIKEGAIVIDAGINPKDGAVVGDVEFAAAKERAGWITPVPGGVGPVTAALLLHNTVLLAERRLRA